MDERAKLKRFASDLAMKDAVYRVLLTAFLKPRKDADVHTLAAKSISIDMLQEAWKDIERYREDEREASRSTDHV